MPRRSLLPLPPKVRKYPRTTLHHGIRRTDNYAWLKAKNWREVFKDPDALTKNIRTHLEAENAYQKTLMAKTCKLQKQLVAEMKSRIKANDSSVPEKDGAYAYGVSFISAGEQPHYFRTPRRG